MAESHGLAPEASTGDHAWELAQLAFPLPSGAVKDIAEPKVAFAQKNNSVSSRRAMPLPTKGVSVTNFTANGVVSLS